MFSSTIASLVDHYIIYQTQYYFMCLFNHFLKFFLPNDQLAHGQEFENDDLIIDTLFSLDTNHLYSIHQVFQLLLSMQSGKPEKILGKKFVRGKPYYKIKWEGSAKDQSTWETPASLKNFKSMINKYEIKNWGSPLDDKFFDVALYSLKAANYKQKKPEKKQLKAAKRAEKKKIEEPTSESEESGRGSSVDGNEYRKIDNGTEESKEKVVRLNNEHQQDELQIIDLDTDERNNREKEQAKKLDNHSNNKFERNHQRRIAPSSIDIQELIVEGQEKKDGDPHCEYQRDLGLVLPKAPTTPENPTGTDRPQKGRNSNLGLINAVSVEVQGVKRIKQIVHIYHLEKTSFGNHLYLVEFEDKDMRKMATRDLIIEHPQDFVCFLEKRFRARDI